jgi:ubiquitin carboxyl-terminal hydrolase 2/21
MNATIQCLCNVFYIKKYFQDKQLIYNDTNNKKCPLTIEFYKLINIIWQSSYNGKSYYSPKAFKNLISEMNPLFKGIAANDSKDLILFLYETIHTEINNPNSKNQKIINQNSELQFFRNSYYSNNWSFLVKYFYFEQQSFLRCYSCGFNKESYNIINILIFPLEKVREYMTRKKPEGFASVSLYNCFENFQEEELLSGANMIYCNNCKRNSNAGSSNKIFTSPEVMTIILNRGKGLEFSVEFDYPSKINIDEFVNDKSCKNNIYELIGVLTHIDPSGMSGHFIAFCKSPVNGKWYCYNDATVTQTTDPRSQNVGIPYVLFYQKINPNKPIDNIMQKNNSNEITLYFSFNNKEYYLGIENNILFKDIIIKLRQKLNISKNICLFFCISEKCIRLEDNKTPIYYNLKNYDKIAITEI